MQGPLYIACLGQGTNTETQWDRDKQTCRHRGTETVGHVETIGKRQTDM